MMLFLLLKLRKSQWLVLRVFFKTLVTLQVLFLFLLQFQCYLEECKTIFKNAQERRDHCISLHKFPSDFRFDEARKKLPNKNVKGKPKNAKGKAREGKSFYFCF